MKDGEFLTRLIELPDMVSRIKSSSFVSGQHKPIFPSGGTEFENSAPYNHGDDAKNYSYRLSARMGKPMKKITKEEKDSRCFCLVDSRPSLLFGAMRTKLDFAFEIGAILGLSAIESDDQAVLLTLPINDTLTKKSCTRSKTIFINEVIGSYTLSYNNKNQTENLVGSINELVATIPSYSTVFLISDWMFQSSSTVAKKSLAEQDTYKQMREALESLTTKRDVVLISIRDILDIQLPNGLWRMSGHGTRPTSIVGGHSRHQQTLDQLHQERKAWLDEIYSNLGIDYCELYTTNEFEHIPELISFFAQR